MDEIFQAEATKRDGQASRSPDLPSTDSSAIAIGHSVSRPEGSAALIAESRSNPNEQRPATRAMTLNPGAVARALGGEARCGQRFGARSRSVVTNQLLNWPVGARLLTKKEAAAYCRLSVGAFTRVCPVRAIALQSGNPRLARYDKIDLDAWIEQLKNGPNAGGSSELGPEDYLARLDL